VQIGLLDVLECPLCSGALIPESLAPLDAGILNWGLLRCKCSLPHPVLDGIPIFADSRDSRTDEARSMLAARGIDQASWLERALSRWHPTTPPLAEASCGFSKIYGAGGGCFYEYLAFKWATRSFASGVGLLGAGGPGYFVDLACGLGHLAFIRALARPNDLIVAIDANFRLLQMLRLLNMIPSETPSLLICADANKRLPLINGLASVVLVSDGIHYFREQRHVLLEIRRVLSSAGVAILNHVHNSEEQKCEPAQGFSRPVCVYRDMLRAAGFSSIEAFNDEAIISAVVEGGRFETASRAEIGSHPRSASFLAAPQHRDLLDSTLGSLLCPVQQLALNPVFSVNPSGTEGRLHWPSAYFAKEHDTGFFPGIVEGPLAETSRHRLQLLRKRLVWIPAPLNYFSPDRLRADFLGSVA
jgi:SAM-dependent methyltransferase/uncharacterized protein YbaR (Trm112 family)